jgi:hypothetical protein
MGHASAILRIAYNAFAEARTVKYFLDVFARNAPCLRSLLNG